MPLSANGIPVQKWLPLLCNNSKKKKKKESKSWTAIKPIKKQVGLFYSYIKNNLLSQNNVTIRSNSDYFKHRAGKCLKKN